MRKILFAALAAALVLASCANPFSGNLTDEEAVLAARIVNAGMPQAVEEAAKAAVARSSATATYNYTINADVLVDGKTYHVQGAFSASMGVDDTNLPLVVYTMAVHSSGLSITGPDLNYTLAMDYTATISLNTDTGNGSVTLQGVIGANTFDCTVAF
ncbi:MAG: hypothetical protein JW923_08170 [Spirochaetales bacterium]|nr:hypothetical protein [Spirochaetales bacterium]